MFHNTVRCLRQTLAQKRNFITFINTSEVGIRQTFGREGGIFTSDILAKPGLRVFIPILQTITPISTRIKQDTYRFETKTLDNWKIIWM